MKAIAHFFSIILHPTAILTYMAVLISLINPYLFGVRSLEGNSVFILQVFFSTFFLPVVATVLMYFLGFIESLQMKDKQERIGPMIATLVFYTWVAYNFYKSSVVPTAFTVFTAGATIAMFFAFVINVFSKISLHAIGMGGLLGMVLLTMVYYDYGTFEVMGWMVSTNLLLIIVILLSGIVCSSRLILDAHEPIELYGGFFIGFGTQFLAMTLLT